MSNEAREDVIEGVCARTSKTREQAEAQAETLRLRPGDVLLIQLDGPMTPELAKETRETIEQALKSSPDTADLVGRVAVLLHDDGVTFRIVRATQEEEGTTA